MNSLHAYEDSSPDRQPLPKNKDSFAHLVNTYFPVLCQFAFGIIKDQDCAKDIVQEVLVRYWNGTEEFYGPASLKAWLYQATKNRCLNELRSRQRSATHHNNAQQLEEPGDDSILANIVKAETLASIYAVVKEMPAQMRTVFEMHFLEGMPVREIAEHLGIASKTVSNHRYNALTALRAKLTKDADALVLIWMLCQLSNKEL